MSIDLYAARLSPPCRSVMMTAKLLNIDLNFKTTDLSQGMHMTSEYLKMNPAHTIPTIDDNGFILWESRAIMQYLCNKYAPDNSLYPKDSKKRAVVDRYLYFDMSFPTLLRESLFYKLLTDVDPPEDKVNALKNNLKLLDQLIGDNKYLTGNDLTIADLALFSTTLLFEFLGYDVTDYPNFKHWFSRLQSEVPFGVVNDVDKQEFFGYVEKAKTHLSSQKHNQ